MEDNKLILISELISDKRRKEKELEFYESELRKLLLRLSLVRHEINTTETIIKLIQQEQIVDLVKYIKDKENT
mgnify:CR=1 FL=1|tara:strand:- start:177 stop:395 length:219 start_codon:yes stop_codon:yes gene_type:complete